MNLLDQHFLWASLIWGSVASGYLVYGWKQRAAIPLVGGAIMTIASFFMPALIMSLVSVATIAAVWWLVRRGY